MYKFSIVREGLIVGYLSIQCLFGAVDAQGT